MKHLCLLLALLACLALPACKDASTPETPPPATPKAAAPAQPVEPTPPAPPQSRPTALIPPTTLPDAPPLVPPATLPAAPAVTAATPTFAATDTAALLKAAQEADAKPKGQKPTVIVTGTVVTAAVSASGKVALITFKDATGRGAFHAAYFTRSFAGMEKKFGGKNGDALAGKNVRLTGFLQVFRDAPEMVLDSPAQIDLAP